MTDYRETFHKELKSFLKNLCKTFDEDRELMMITTSLLIALSDDPNNEVIKQFYTTVRPYLQDISDRNPQFFYKVNLDGSEYKLLTKIHLYWEKLSPADQSVVWEYIQVLVLLSQRVLITV